jgi:hypothetical protein
MGRQAGRRAAENGLTSIALMFAVVNLVLKPLGNRRRPDRQMYDVPVARQVTMPRSTSWPSGQVASAFAFAYAFPSPERPDRWVCSDAIVDRTVQSGKRRYNRPFNHPAFVLGQASSCRARWRYSQRGMPLPLK